MKELRKPSRYLVITSSYLLPALLTALSLVGVYLLFYSPIFRLQEFVCQIDTSPCAPGPTTAELERLRGQNIFLFKEESLTNHLTSGDFSLAKVQVEKVYPNKLTLTLTTYKQAIVVKSTTHSEYLVLDERRRVLTVTASPPPVPILEVTELPPAQIGQTLESELDLAVASALLVKGASLPVKRMLYEEKLLRLTLDSGSTALLDPSGDMPRQIALLQAVLRDRTITKGVATIDVRYSQPVLK